MTTAALAPDTRLDVQEETEQEQELEWELDETLEPRWKVIIHNDDVTPYDFVVSVLQKIFGLNHIQAEVVTFTAHSSGAALVAILPRSEAQEKMGKAHFAAALEGYPLTFTAEPE